MAFNHDNFIAMTNYTDLDTLLQWYIDTVSPQLSLLYRLADDAPGELRNMYLRDPVLQKFRVIGDNLAQLIEAAQA